MTIEDVLRLREELWNEHPIIVERAVLPTLAAKDVVARVWALGRKSRGSIAFFARPLSGKSSCAELLLVEMKRKKPGCGVLIFEVVEDTKPAEGRLLSEILNQIDYAPKIARDLADKRTQVHRALLALSGDSKHLFLIFDEAQELSCSEFAWLKSVINRLVRERVKVTVVLFGQVELKDKRDQLKTARSDLEKRFMSSMIELKGIRDVDELEPLLAAIDVGSEFPAGSGLSYLNLLLPKFFQNGGRLTSFSKLIWSELKKRRLPGTGTEVSMSGVAGYLASLFLQLRELDGAELTITAEMLRDIGLN